MISILSFLLWIAGLQGAQAQPGIAAAGNRAVARASISGTTAPSDSTQPLSSVTLRLVPVSDPSSGTTFPAGRGGTNPINYQATSDAIGRFTFSGIIPGRYYIAADREGYEHYQTGPGQPNSEILTVSSGQTIENLIVVMTSIPTISGTVYNPYGKSMAGVSVSAYRVKYTPYGRQVARVATVLSHEGGEYRLFNLNPGSYYVGASYSDRSIQPWKSLLEISPNLSRPDDGYSTIYFPAEMRIADARAINLNNGAVANVDIAFRESRYYRLSITLMLPVPQGPNISALQNTKVAIFPAGTDLGSAQDYVIKGSGTRFNVDHLAEGDYVLVALADLQNEEGNTYSGIVSDPRPIRLISNSEVTIATMYPIEIPGNVARTAGINFPNGMQLQLTRIDTLASQTIVADLDSTGQFNLMNVGPGTYDVFLKGKPNNAYLQEARFPNGDPRLLQIRVDDTSPPRTWRCDAGCTTPRLISDFPLRPSISLNASTLGGSVVDGRGAKAASAEVVLVPNDATARLRRDRYVVTFTDASGTFMAQGIPPGTYTVYAFERIEPDIYFDPDFNIQISPLGRSLTIGPGNSRPLDRALTLISKDDFARYVQ